MHITNSLISFPKEAQTLENVKTLDPLTDREVIRAIRDAIIAEEGAINQYETVVDSTDNEEIKKVLQEIADEEKVHVGELQALLNKYLPDEEGLLEEGAKEVEEAEDSEPTEEVEEVEVELEEDEDEATD